MENGTLAVIASTVCTTRYNIVETLWRVDGPKTGCLSSAQTGSQELASGKGFLADEVAATIICSGCNRQAPCFPSKYHGRCIGVASV
jgi:hypothetical protein